MASLSLSAEVPKLVGGENTVLFVWPLTRGLLRLGNGCTWLHPDGRRPRANPDPKLTVASGCYRAVGGVER